MQKEKINSLVNRQTPIKKHDAKGAPTAEMAVVELKELKVETTSFNIFTKLDLE